MANIVRKIRDFLGRTLTPGRPDLKEIATMALRDRWSGYPSMGLTPGTLAQIFLLADAGYPRPQAELFEEIEEKDTQVATCLQTRKLAVSALPWEVEPFSESPQDQDIAKFCEEALREINDFEDDMTDLLDAVGKGYAVSEILWETVDRNVIPVDLKWIHAKKVSFVNSLTPRILTEDEPALGIDPPPWKMIYHRLRARSGFDMRAGTLRVIAYLYLLKIYAWKDWATFNEVYGMPLRVGKYPTGMSEPDKQALRDAIRNLGSDAGGIISSETEIQFIDSASRGTGRQIPFAVMINQINREMSKAILGQTLTTDTEGSTGTYAAGKVHADVRQDIVAADARALMVTLRTQLLRPIVGFNFGWDKPVPVFRLHFEEGEDLKESSEVVKNLSACGFPFVAEDLSERFGFALPSEDGKETVLVPATKAAQPVQTAPGETMPPDQGKTPGADGAPPGEAQTPPGDGSGDGNAPGPKGDPVAQAMVKAAEDKAAAKSLAQVVELFKGMLPSSTDPIVAQELKTIQIMTENEDDVQAALAKAAPVFARVIAPIQDVIRKAGSLEEAAKQLQIVYPSMPKKELAGVLFQVMMLAWMKGRLGDFGRVEQ